MSFLDRVAQEIEQNGEFSRATTLPAIPAVGSDLASLARAVEAMKKRLEVREGLGSQLDRSLTLRDLIDAGAVQLQVGGRQIGQTSGALLFAGQGTPGPKGDPGQPGPPGLPGGGFADPRPILEVPPALGDFTVLGGFGSVSIEWTMVEYQNHRFVEIFRANSNSRGAATLIGTTTTNFYFDKSAELGQVYYYWGRAVGIKADGTTVYGPDNAVSGTPGGRLLINGVDLAPLLIDATKIASGAVTAAKLADQAVTATKFANGIQPVTIITGPLPTSVVTRTIFRTDDGKLYRWNGSAYVATVPAADIAGQVQAAQIAALEASKITGQLTNAQIASIAAAKLTGQITSTQITDSAISTPKLAAGAVLADKIAAGAVVADKIASNAVTAAKIQAGAVTAGKLAANSVQAGNIAAGAVTAGTIAANAVTASEIAANAITAGKIAAGAVNAQQIAAGAITASKMTLTDMSNVFPDFDMMDDALYSSSTGASYTFGQTGYTSAGRRRLRIEASADAESVETGWFQVEPGAEYRVELHASNEAGTPVNATASWALGSMDAGSVVTQTSTGVIISTTSTNTGAKYSVNIVAGPSERRMRLIFGRSAGGTAMVTFGGVVIRRRSNANLIVDGSITAEKIQAGAVVAGKVAANAIVASNIVAGTITGDRLAVETITGDRIQAGTITGNRIQAGTITANLMQAGLLQADNVLTRGLTVRDNAGNVIFGVNDPLNHTRISPSSGWLNSNISINGSGQIQGIGTGSGAAVANDLLLPAIAEASLTADWETVVGRPAGLARVALGSMHTGGYGSVRFLPNQNGGAASNDGEIGIQGEAFYHPDGVKRTITSGRTVLTPFEGGLIQDPFFLIYTDTPPDTRFPAQAGQWGDSPQFFSAIYDVNADVWSAVANNNIRLTFAPDPSDCIVAVGGKTTTSGGFNKFSSLVGVNQNMPADGATVGAPSGTPVGSTTADTVAAATSAVNNSTTGLNQRMRLNAQNILAAGAGVSAGTLTWNSSGVRTGGRGVGINVGGIVAYDATGFATLAVSAETGLVEALGLSVKNRNGDVLLAATGNSTRPWVQFLGAVGSGISLVEDPNTADNTAQLRSLARGEGVSIIEGSGTLTISSTTPASSIALANNYSISSTNFQHVDGMSLPLLPNSVYVVTGYMLVRSAAATTGAWIGCEVTGGGDTTFTATSRDGPATAQVRSAHSPTGGGLAAYFSAHQANINASNTFSPSSNSLIEFSAVVKTGSSAGSFRLILASEVEGSAITLMSGSVLRAERVVNQAVSSSSALNTGHGIASGYTGETFTTGEPADASVALRIRPNGTWEITRSGFATVSGTWLSSGSSATWDLQFSVTGTSGLTGISRSNPASDFTPINADLVYKIEAYSFPSSAELRSGSSTVAIRFRNRGTGSITTLATTTLTAQAESDYGGGVPP